MPKFLEDKLKAQAQKKGFNRRDEDMKKYKGQSASFSTHRPVRKVLRRTV